MSLRQFSGVREADSLAKFGEGAPRVPQPARTNSAFLRETGSKGPDNEECSTERAHSIILSVDFP